MRRERIGREGLRGRRWIKKERGDKGGMYG